jgi:hypothetical protein
VFVIEALTSEVHELVVDPGDPVAQSVTAHRQASHFRTLNAAEQVRRLLTHLRQGRRPVTPTDRIRSSRVRACGCRLESFKPPRPELAAGPLPLLAWMVEAGGKDG